MFLKLDYTQAPKAVSLTGRNPKSVSSEKGKNWPYTCEG